MLGACGGASGQDEDDIGAQVTGYWEDAGAGRIDSAIDRKCVLDESQGNNKQRNIDERRNARATAEAIFRSSRGDVAVTIGKVSRDDDLAVVNYSLRTNGSTTNHLQMNLKRAESGWCLISSTTQTTPEEVNRLNALILNEPA